MPDRLRFAGTAARIVTGARRGRPTGRFWSTRAYSRIVHWGRDFRAVQAYVYQNELEGLGIARHRSRTGPRRASAERRE